MYFQLGVHCENICILNISHLKTLVNYFCVYVKFVKSARITRHVCIYVQLCVKL